MAAAGSTLGTWGEDVASAWYRAAGFAVVDRNWRCPLGELDLVVHRRAEPAVLAFVEVKARSSRRFGTPADALTASKRRRVRRAAAAWLVAHPRAGGWGDLRFDLVSVTPGPRQGGAEPGMDARAGDRMSGGAPFPVTSTHPASARAGSRPVVEVIEHAF